METTTALMVLSCIPDSLMLDDGNPGCRQVPVTVAADICNRFSLVIASLRAHVCAYVNLRAFEGPSGGGRGSLGVW